jgi:hypothetical protein
MKSKYSHILPIIALLSLSIMMPVEAAVDNCMVGKWKPNPEQLKQQFGQLTKQVITNVTGQIILNLSNDGAGIYQLDNFTMSMKGSEQVPMEMTLIMDGTSKFSWSVEDKKFVMNNEKMNIKTSGSINMGGMKMPIPSIPINDEQAASGVANGGYSCSGNELTFEPETEGSVLQTWHRVEE